MHESVHILPYRVAQKPLVKQLQLCINCRVQCVYVLAPSSPLQSQEMVIIVGRPASGKSTLRERHFTPHGYVAVNRDTLGTQEKCLKMASESLKAGKSVIVDNTNPSKAVRQPYIDIAKKHHVPVRCIYLNVPNEVAFHLNYFRQNQSKGVQRRVPAVGFRVFEKNFQMPEVGEGFAEVKTLEFVPQFDSDSDRELFQHWNSSE